MSMEFLCVLGSVTGIESTISRTDKIPALRKLIFWMRETDNKHFYEVISSVEKNNAG